MKQYYYQNIYTTLTLRVGRKEKEEQHPLVAPLAEDCDGGITVCDCEDPSMGRK